MSWAVIEPLPALSFHGCCSAAAGVRSYAGWYNGSGGGVERGSPVGSSWVTREHLGAAAVGVGQGPAPADVAGVSRGDAYVEAGGHTRD